MIHLEYYGEDSVIFATSMPGTPYKFCRSGGFDTGVWMDYLSSDPDTKVLTIYYSTDRGGFVIASGGPKGWANELFVNININNFSSFTLTFQESSATFDFAGAGTHDYTLEPNLTRSQIRYLRWGQGLIPRLSLAPNEHSAVPSNSTTASDEIQEDLPVEYFVLSARLKRLEDACLKAGIEVR